MFASLRVQLFAVLLPLSVASIGACTLLGLELIRFESDLLRFREHAATALSAQEYARDLERALVDAFDLVLDPTSPHEGFERSLLALQESYERLSPLVERRPADAPGLAIGDLASVETAVQSQTARAVALAANGKRNEARKLLVDDLDALVSARAGKNLDRLVRDALRECETLLPLLEDRASWSIRRWLAPTDGMEILSSVYQSALARRFETFAYREYRATARPLLAERDVDPTRAAAHGDAARAVLAQLRSLANQRTDQRTDPGADTSANQSGDQPAEAPTLEAAYAHARGGYADVVALAQAGDNARSAAALGVLRRVVDGLVETAPDDAPLQLSRIERAASSIHAVAIGLGLAAFLLVLVTTVVASRRLVGPISRLADAVRKLGQGDDEWSSGLALKRGDDLGLVSRAFARIATELGASSRKIRTLSFYDNVTGLPNRDLFIERLEGALVTSRLQSHTMGVLTIGLDSFKQVNESMGHRAGDELLRQIAERLNRSVRVRDIVAHPGDPETAHEVSRLGGSHFTILLTRLAHAQDTAMVAERVLSELSRAFRINDSEITGRANVGISIFPLDGGDAETLLSNSKAALMHARALEPNTYQFYSEAMNAHASRKLQIGARLRGALDRGDLHIHFQPFHSTRSGEITGAEVLLRWQDEEFGAVSPAEFIPVAEETGLITTIGSWVLREACAQARRWQDAGYRPVRIAVNVSAHQLRQNSFAELVAEVLKQTGVSAAVLEVEITESAIIVDEASTLATLVKLRELGIGISLDDFGTGYSSLSYLRRFPISRVKIDRSFVAEIVADSDGTELTAAIVAMAKSLQLGVIAEGIESEDQARYLAERGCDELQGYLISRPIPASEFEHYLVHEKDDELP